MEALVEKQFVRDLKVGDQVRSAFLVTEKALVAFNQPNRSGEQFLRMQLADVSGTVRAVAWEKGMEYAKVFQVGDVIRVRGEVGEYKGPQVVVYGIEPVEEAQVERGWFQRVAPTGSDEMLAELKTVLDGVSDPFLALLLQEFFSDSEFFKRYTKAPAARSVHHNYVGGLLEHSLEVAVLCRQFAAGYPELDLSLLYCGALLHDVGKIEEYDSTSLTFELTDRGKLLGHIMIGQEMLEQRIRAVPGFPEAYRLELMHMLLSHHGQKEWGSPEIPKTFAAYALFHADLVSARLNQFSLVVKKGEKDNGWTDWDRLLERSVYLGKAE
jgi:3'-5' exoribonuclease